MFNISLTKKKVGLWKEVKKEGFLLNEGFFEKKFENYLEAPILSTLYNFRFDLD